MSEAEEDKWLNSILMPEMDQLPVMMTVDGFSTTFDHFISSPHRQYLSDDNTNNELNYGDDTRATFTSSHLLLSVLEKRAEY
ncbi:hypothetical protein QVD17_39844 [Tagetes erecta]|uniref:Uncharacterized protein n=1 Tax=Tagetes erecta TaxID=13708 RepID=A0AAD8JRI2_TARER|nr:hypothetical protein QVD17_39844 [Tagetes erecta]